MTDSAIGQSADQSAERAAALRAAIEAAPGPTLTRAEDLLFQVAIARHRLGENLYAIESRHRPTAKSLAAKGLIWIESGNVERTIRVGLTLLGELVGISPTYVPPALDPNCRSWYFGPKVGIRVDCERRRDHKGKHRYSLTFPASSVPDRIIKWTDEEARGLGDPFYAGRLRAFDEQAAAERAALTDALIEGRIDWSTGLPIASAEAATDSSS